VVLREAGVTGLIRHLPDLKGGSDGFPVIIDSGSIDLDPRPAYNPAFELPQIARMARETATN